MSGKPPFRPTRATRRLLLALLLDAPRMSGVPLSRVAQVGYGTVYVILARLERCGWVAGIWEEGPPAGHRRRLYRLTPEGRIGAAELLKLKEPSHYE